MATDPFGEIGRTAYRAESAPGAFPGRVAAAPWPGVQRVSVQEAQGGAPPMPSIVMPAQAAVETDYTPVYYVVGGVIAVGVGYWLYKKSQRRSIWKSIRTPRRE
jgi:2-keto-3-deoxy-6-phosphogluconate aldolase